MDTICREVHSELQTVDVVIEEFGGLLPIVIGLSHIMMFGIRERRMEV